MTELRYYDSALGIDGTADDLARFATQYADDYSDEAFLKIIKILNGEGRDKDAKRVAFELESRMEKRAGKRDLGRLKLWALDGMFNLIDDQDEGAFFLRVFESMGYIIISTERHTGECGVNRITLDEFLEMDVDTFEHLINETNFYAVDTE